MTIVAFAVSLVISACLTFALAHGSRFTILDTPNERSLHTKPTPRTGGVAIVLAIGMGSIVAAFGLEVTDPSLAWVVLGALLVATVSFMDDWYSLRVKHRLVVHILAAGSVIYGGFVPNHLALTDSAWIWPEVIGVAFTLIFVVWAINLYNFMDGMDGLAAGMAIVAFGTYGLIGFLEGGELFGTLALVVAGSAFGFLLFNFPPARIFMGDTGSSTLGFLAAVFALWGVRDQLIPFWISVVLLSPFIVDATVTLVKRTLAGEKFWKAHKTHYYQRLVQAGWGHRRTAIAEYGIMCSMSGLALIALYGDAVTQWVVMALVVLAYLVLIVAVRRIEEVWQQRNHDEN
ncbi:MAG: glycosyltransferase family 4 protein [Pseudomonadota bacterium]|nr:MAG: glycosyltransferase family 4 protein [Pseudomonadota bacterium]